MGDTRMRSLRRMAIACAVLVMAIISISAFIRHGNAGLGCADWPQCYGSNLRQAQQGTAPHASEGSSTVVARMLHRIVAVAALLLIIVMVMACFAVKPVLWHEGGMALTLLALAVFLAVLGRWSGGARVPVVNVGNLLGGFVMLACCWRMVQSGGNVGLAKTPPRMQWLTRATVLILLGQIALGGLVSAGFAGLSCIGMTDCGWSLPTTPTLDAFNAWREPLFEATPTLPANRAGAAIHLGHRYAAVVLTLAVGLLAWFSIRAGRARGGWVLIGLLGTELLFGVLMVILSLPLGIVLAHNLVAALLLAVVIALL